MATRRENGQLSLTQRGFAFGLIYGSALGAVFSAVTHRPAFLAIGVGAGISLGLALGAWQERRKSEGAGDEEPADEPRPG